MLKNFFKVAFRNIWKNKGFSAINITGLAIGMASATLLLLWIYDEVSYDQFHQKRIGFMKHGTGPNSVVSYIAGTRLLKCLVRQ